MRASARTQTLAVGLALLAALATAYAWRAWPLRVETVQPVRGPAIEAVYATGTVEPTVMVPVAPRVGARLLAIEAEEGQQVRSGQLLARLESDDLEHTVREMRAREQLARAQYERSRQLAAQRFVSQAEVDRARSELQAAQAAASRAQAQRDYSQLVAPADGIILRRDGEAGQFVPAGQAVFSLACCAPLRVTAEVDEEDIARVQIGQQVSLRGDALPGRLFEGRVAEITPKGDPVSRSYRVRIQLQDAPPVTAGPLRTGMTMDANIVVARRDDALLLPNRALQSDLVWLLQDGRLRKRPVTKGAAGRERTEIRSGLAEGEQVVLAPTDSLREGRRAHGRPAPAAAPSPAASKP
ncbi:efflux RND transporter periplasmic adaptor subunit [Variovorax sp. LARHSF232]